MDIFVEQFPFLGTKIVQKHPRNTEGKNYIDANVLYIFFFSNIEKKKKVA